MMKSRSFLQKSFSKSFSLNHLKHQCMAWFRGLKERKNEKNDYTTHTLHIFFSFTYKKKHI